MPGTRDEDFKINECIAFSIFDLYDNSKHNNDIYNWVDSFLSSSLYALFVVHMIRSRKEDIKRNTEILLLAIKIISP